MDQIFNNRILITDDQPEIIEDYLKILAPQKNTKKNELAKLEADLFGYENSDNFNTKQEEERYIIDSATQGEEAIAFVKKSVSEKNFYALAFIDVRMPPGIDGIHTAAKIQKIDPNIEIVFVTAYSDYTREEILKLMKYKNKFFFIRKPFDVDEIKQLALALTEKWNLGNTVTRKNQELLQTRTITISVLAELAELRDTDTGEHIKRVSEYSKFIAYKLAKLQEPKWCSYITERYIKDIGESSILHDIGKIGIPDSVLLKKGKLTDEEFNLMKTHTTIGGDALSKAVKEIKGETFLTLAREIAYYHHEKFDGSGYSMGLKGESIPLSARIVALADVYDALTSNRPYRKELTHDTAYKIIVEEMGEAHFDPIILNIFKKYNEKFLQIKEKISSLKDPSLCTQGTYQL